MNLHKNLFILLIALITSAAAIAGPGAHGPNGEHLDLPSANATAQGSVPRIETFTETFELVGQLLPDELSILIDRYESNEPVLGGKLEVELNGIKAVASFHADHGDYAITDKKLLQALAKPGKHNLIFTFAAGEESDLLEATLEVAAHNDHHAEQHTEQHADHGRALAGSGHKGWGMLGLILATIALVVLIAKLASRRRRNQSTRKTA